MKKEQILKKSAALMLFTLFSRVLGLAREIVRAAYLGTAGASDAFALGFQIPNLLRRLFAEGSIAVAFVPVFKGLTLEDNKQKIKEFLSSFFTVLTFIVTTTVVLLIIFTTPLISLFFKDLKPETFKKTVFLTKLMFPYLGFISVAAFFQGILNTKNIFSPSGFTPILFNISVIFSTIILSKTGFSPEIAMAIGVVLGGFLQMIFQLPFVLKTGFRFSLTPLTKAFKNPSTKKVLLLIVPTIAGMAAYQINILVSSIIATKAGTGTVSSLQFSNRLLELILGIFAVSIGTVMLSELSKNAQQKKWKELNKNLIFSINSIALITIPSAIFAYLFSSEIVALLFKFKNFDANSVKLTAYAFSFHILGLYFIATNRILSPAFYAMQNTKLPTIAGIFSVVVNIIFAFSLVSSMKGGGIALASTIAAVSNTILLLFFMTKQKTFDIKQILKNTVSYLIKILFVGFLSIIPIFFIKNRLFSLFLSLKFKIFRLGLPIFIDATIFFTLFFVILLISKDNYLNFLLSKIRRKKS